MAPKSFSLRRSSDAFASTSYGSIMFFGGRGFTKVMFFFLKIFGGSGLKKTMNFYGFRLPWHQKPKVDKVADSFPNNAKVGDEAKIRPAGVGRTLP